MLFLNCVEAGCALSLFLEVPCVGLWSVIMSVPGHTHLLFEYRLIKIFLVDSLCIVLIRLN